MKTASPDKPTVDLTGQVFGKWRVASYAGKHREATRTTDEWNCVCECGSKQVIQKGNLVNGLSTQCKSCASSSKRKWKEPKKFRHYWNKARQDCCPEWLDSATFEAWASKTRTAKVLRRRDSSKPYSPENCFWAEGYGPGDEFRDKVVSLRMSIHGETEQDARDWFSSVSHQRRYKWFAENKNRLAVS